MRAFQVSDSADSLLDFGLLPDDRTIVMCTSDRVFKLDTAASSNLPDTVFYPGFRDIWYGENLQ
jgi:hypothetical protein